jgi:hypothetical protein
LEKSIKRVSKIEVRSRHIWEDNIKIDLREIGLGGVDWIHLAHDRDQWHALVKTVMNIE